MNMKKTYLSAAAILVVAGIVGSIAGMSFYPSATYRKISLPAPM